MGERHTIAIVGGGVIGGGWAARFLLSGWNVNVFDPDPDAERKMAQILANARRSMPSLTDTELPLEGSLTFFAELEGAVGDVNWIQESVPERLDVKHRVYDQIQQHASESAVLASSTSGFKPSELARYARHPEQILVCHPFNPVYLLPLVEVVPHANSDPAIVEAATATLTAIGMKPLLIRREIDAHIADRLLEAVWREALWLVHDAIATTEEIDDAIRYGFGLRWAQMGLFETYRLAGGEAGMVHFISQFGPCLELPWTKLTDVPHLSDKLVQTIADQSEAQSGQFDIRRLEQIRDDNLVAIMRALKQQDWGAGAVLNQHDRSKVGDRYTSTALDALDLSKPITTVERTIPLDWLDYNGHATESSYLQAFSEATNRFMALIGCDTQYIENCGSYFTAETHIRHLNEAHAGCPIHIDTQCLFGEGKKLHLFHSMYTGEQLLATGEQMLLHVSPLTRRTSPPAPQIEVNLKRIAASHANLPLPEGAGRAISRR